MSHRTRLIYRIPSFKEGITRILIFLVELKMISLLSPKNMIPFKQKLMIRLKKAIAFQENTIFNRIGANISK